MTEGDSRGGQKRLKRRKDISMGRARWLYRSIHEENVSS